MERWLLPMAIGKKCHILTVKKLRVTRTNYTRTLVEPIDQAYKRIQSTSQKVLMNRSKQMEQLPISDLSLHL